MGQAGEAIAAALRGNPNRWNRRYIKRPVDWAEKTRPEKRARPNPNTS